MHRMTWVSWSVMILSTLALIAGGCSNKDDDDNVAVDPISDLIDNGGGTLGGSHSGTVTVVVFDEQDHTRIASATVLLDDGSGAVSKDTDDSGTAVFENVATGTYDVHVAKTGFAVLSVFGFDAATAAWPLNSERLQVTGTVVGGSTSGTTYTLEFKTLEPDPFNVGSEEPEYGEVIDAPSGGDPTYEVEIDKGATDTLIFTETQNSTGKIVNRKEVVIGPYTANQSGVNVTFDGTTGLHEITGTISNLQNLVTTGVDVTYHDRSTLRSYSAYDVSGSGVSRTYSMQIPPDQTLNLAVEASIVGGGKEVQVFPISSGAADNATPATQDFALDMVTISGDFTNYGSTAYVVLLAHYDDINAQGVGTPALGYTFRVPRNKTMTLTLVGANGSGTLERALNRSWGPFSISSTENFDLASSAPTLTTITTNQPDVISTHVPSAGLLSLHANDDLAQPPFFGSGSTSGSDLVTDLRWIPRTDAASTIFLVSDKETYTVEPEHKHESLYILGNITDPATTIGTSQTITLLEVPDFTSPTNGSTPPAQVTFTWTGDTNIGTHGFVQINIERTSTDERVWTVVLHPSVTTATLPDLPTALDGLELQNSVQYRWWASSIYMENLDLGNLRIDEFSNTFGLFKSGQKVKFTGTEERTFTVN